MNVNVMNMHYAGNTWLTETGLKEIVPVELWGVKKVFFECKSIYSALRHQTGALAH